MRTSNKTFSARNSLDQACNTRAIACLKMETVNSMINAFLTEKEMSKKELATALVINIAEFEKFCSDCGSREFMSEISYRLIVFYCRTKWNHYQKRTN